MPEAIKLAEFRNQKRPQPLHSFGGGGTSGGMDIVDAKIAAAEARTDTKFAQVLGRLDGIEKSTSGIRATVIVTGISAVALVVAIFGWGSAMFGSGMDVQTAADRAASAVESRYAEQNAAATEQMNEATIALTHALAQIEAQRAAVQETP